VSEIGIDYEMQTNMRIAKAQLNAATKASDRLLEEHSAAFRWLMASFLAINGGGLLVLKDLGAPWNKYEIAAGFAFYAGIVAALAIAWLGQKASRAALTPFSKLSSFWTTVAATGEYSITDHREILAEFPLVERKSRFAPLAGWLALLAFTFGLILLGAGQGSKQVSLKKNSEATTIEAKSKK